MRYKEMPEEVRKYLSNRFLALGVFFLLAGAIWLSQILGLFKQTWVLPLIFLLEGIFLLGEGWLARRV